MVLLSSYEKMADCALNIIKLGEVVDWKSQAHIIGRPLQGYRSLSRQPVDVVDFETISSPFLSKNLNIKNTICVINLGKCPVRAGDLLIQNGQLFGLASTSSHITDQNNMACFADIRIVKNALMILDPDIFAT